MNRSILERLERNIGELNPAKAAIIEMNGRSLSSLLIKIKHAKQDLREVADDDSLFYHAFIENARAKWKDDEGNEIVTSLECFLTDDGMEEIVERRQMEIRSHIDRLAALETKFNMIINSPKRKGRREQIQAALDLFATYSQNNAGVERRLPQSSCPTQHCTDLQILISRLKAGIRPGRSKGQSDTIRKRDQFVVNSGRNYNKKYGVHPAISRNFFAAEAIQSVGGPFVRHAIADQDFPDDLNTTQIAESLRRIKKYMKETPDHPDGFLSKRREPEQVFSSILKKNK